MVCFESPVVPSTSWESIGDATSVLLTGPSGDDRVTETGLSFLSSPAPAATHAHWATMLRPPDAMLRAWSTHVGDAPASLTLVEVGETRRGSGSAPVDGPPHSRAHVASPSDLTTLGIRLTEGRASPATGETRRLWLESLSTLLQHVPLADAFQFVHALHRRLADTDAAVCYHLDPTVHEVRTVHTFLASCDVWLAVDGDELVTRRRPALDSLSAPERS